MEQSSCRGRTYGKRKRGETNDTFAQTPFLPSSRKVNDNQSIFSTRLDQNSFHIRQSRGLGHGSTSRNGRNDLGHPEQRFCGAGGPGAGKRRGKQQHEGGKPQHGVKKMDTASLQEVMGGA